MDTTTTAPARSRTPRRTGRPDTTAARDARPPVNPAAQATTAAQAQAYRIQTAAAATQAGDPSPLPHWRAVPAGRDGDHARARVVVREDREHPAALVVSTVDGVGECPFYHRDRLICWIENRAGFAIGVVIEHSGENAVPVLYSVGVYGGCADLAKVIGVDHGIFCNG